jgi:5-methylcytosine-specific restriction endonuclease McrA
MAECTACGSEFQPRTNGGKPQKFCGAKCRKYTAQRAFMDRNRPVRATACAECGGPVVQSMETGRPRRFCSDKCKVRSTNRRSRRAWLPVPKQVERACLHCGKLFKPKRRDTRYCYGRHCAQAAYQLRKANGEPPRMVERTVRCDECGSEFTAKHSSARWCSRRCQVRHRGRESSRRRGPVAPRAEPYTDREIFERDGWRCQLATCLALSRRIDPARSRRHQWGATIDHIIPLSLGGADEPANVVTAHNRCNRDKGVRAANDQLRLI